MARITAFLHMTLDGVTQAPGRPGEDDRGEFSYGGWAGPYFDPAMAGRKAPGTSATTDLLFGRRTYEDFFSIWPSMPDNPFTDILNKSQKFVVSSTLGPQLPWENSTLLPLGLAGVRGLKEKNPRDLVILGSVSLVRSLMKAGLIDHLVLNIFPLTLGRGQRLFDEDAARMEWKLVEAKPTATGVIMSTYQFLGV